MRKKPERLVKLPFTFSCWLR